MSRAEKFISDSTKNYSNEKRITVGKISNWVKQPWLTPDDAKKAVEIAMEEMVEKACDAYCKVCGHYHHTVPTYICRQACDYYEDFKQAMKDE